jgi:hypothetical protein
MYHISVRTIWNLISNKKKSKTWKHYQIHWSAVRFTDGILIYTFGVLCASLHTVVRFYFLYIGRISLMQYDNVFCANVLFCRVLSISKDSVQKFQQNWMYAKKIFLMLLEKFQDVCSVNILMCLQAIFS